MPKKTGGEVRHMEPISRVPIVQQVEERIRELIQEEQYQPGKKLPPEMELCQRLGGGPWHCAGEAFRLLQAKRGVVEIKPGRGAFVAENPAERDIGAIDWLVENERELRDSIEIRTALELWRPGGWRSDATPRISAAWRTSTVAS